MSQLLLLLLAMRAVLSMVLLQLADVSFPAKVLRVDEADGCVSLVISDMIGVGVEPGLGAALHFVV